MPCFCYACYLDLKNLSKMQFWTMISSRSWSHHKSVKLSSACMRRNGKKMNSSLRRESQDQTFLCWKVCNFCYAPYKSCFCNCENCSGLQWSYPFSKNTCNAGLKIKKNDWSQFATSLENLVATLKIFVAKLSKAI